MCVVAGGDVRRRRGQDSCPRTRQVSPAGADGTRPHGMSPPEWFASRAQNVPVIVRKEMDKGMFEVDSKNERASLQSEWI